MATTRADDTPTFTDIYGDGTQLQIWDSGDAVVLVTRYQTEHKGVELEIQVGMGSAELDSLMAALTAIREKRGI